MSTHGGGTSGGRTRASTGGGKPAFAGGSGRRTQTSEARVAEARRFQALANEHEARGLSHAEATQAARQQMAAEDPAMAREKAQGDKAAAQLNAQSDRANRYMYAGVYGGEHRWATIHANGTRTELNARQLQTQVRLNRQVARRNAASPEMRAYYQATVAAERRLSSAMVAFQNAPSIRESARIFQDAWQGARTQAERHYLMRQLSAYYDRVNPQIGRYNSAAARGMTPYQRAFYQMLADYGKGTIPGRMLSTVALAGGPKTEDLPATTTPRATRAKKST